MSDTQYISTFLQLKYSEMNPFTSPHMNSWPRFVNEGNICTVQFKMKALLLFDWITKFEFCRLKKNGYPTHNQFLGFRV